MILESAQAQASSSQKELQDAREYLERLEPKRIESGGVKLRLSLSGETENETVSSSHDDAPNSKGMIRKMSSSESPKATCSKVEGNGDVHVADKSCGNRDHVGEDRSKTRTGRDPSRATNTVEKERTASRRGKKSGQAISIQSTSDHLNVGCSAIEVTECGIPEINGKYHRFESSDGVPAYSKIDSYEGKEAIFTIGRWKSDTGSKKWYTTATVPQGKSPPKQIAFYVAYATSFVIHPPKKNWMVAEGGEPSPDFEGRGILPGPVITHEYNDRGNGKIMGMQVSKSTSTQGNRRNARSASTPRSTRFVFGRNPKT
eukprot:CAMPEP_0172318372 /NCGR_PEP_ID=MMETSP1058-20130122/34731_1 /TAXON_ID=83371 /ORGANISM="Detonula confervacea, Strain CCMP 353" /LENGTH=314 /DNA_ID=CAMNT_0013033201 /DNA_START=34 /DNA_END=978 /DNA_ORIENTATION=-